FDAAFRTRHHHRHADGAIDDHAKIDFPRDVGGVLYEHFRNLLAALAGLLGDERMLEHYLGDRADFLARFDVLDAAEVLAAVFEAPLAAAAGMNLRLENNGPSDLVERLLCLGRRRNDNAARHGSAGRLEEFFRLIFVDLHGVS